MTQQINTDDIRDISQILKLLGDKTRLITMKLLEHQECCVCELVEIINTSQPAISQHLRKLKDAGLVKEERRGQWIFYSTNRENKHYELIEKLIGYVPSQNHEFEALAKKGLRVTCK
ncbi:ArsR/SmtB family transcription factor [Paenibacillus lutrae]|uniref:Metalloregulator ArsR/SmtB family transcription factor n=1 Tax=Paenibacillus lutrae TaxID=2078573 RepID=A0A7X3FEN1_9BACL|nr:metalloregulator ArsR/SmtB family transcription factor [Paenibacillus lutrae]MVO98294.1 metalloregulator ArsR/SmtB family transcription factor [Paenibacillus lutrae]